MLELDTKSGWSQILWYLLIMLVSAMIMTGAAVVLVSLLWGADMIQQMNYSTADEAVWAMRLVQAFSHMGLFLFPPLLFAWQTRQGAGAYLSLKKLPDSKQLLMALALLVLSFPLIGWLLELNQQMHLPAWMSSVEQMMKSMEEEAMALTERMMSGSSFSVLLANLLVMAVLPAIGEELVFRGFLLRYFSAFVRNIHINIFLVALLFSAMHMQFYGFLPRFALGLMLGYLFWWSGTLWLPVFVHFLNNGSTVLVYFLYARGAITTNPEDFGNNSQGWVLLVNSLFLLASFIWFHRQRPHIELP